jgi:hypothetical protein
LTAIANGATIIALRLPIKSRKDGEMKLKRTSLGFASLLFCASAWLEGPALAQVTLPSGYTFTPIVVGNPFTAPISVGSGAQTFPGVNSLGDVTFEGNTGLVNGSYTAYGFFTGNGSGAPTPIITSNNGSIGPLSNFALSINDSGFIGFLGCALPSPTCFSSFVTTVYTSNGTTVNTLATGLLNSTGQAGNVAINNLGSVAFQNVNFQTLPGGSSIVEAAAGGTQTVIASTASGYQNLGPSVSLNNAGTVAFTGTDAVGRTGIFTGNGTTSTLIAHDGGAFGQVSIAEAPSINDSGVVPFAASNIPPGNGLNGVFTSDGTTAGIITTTASGLAFGQAAINNNGVVAFIAGAGSSAQALLVGAAGVAPQTVIQTGDALGGSTMTSFGIGPNAINGVGQITFWASLADGTTGVFRADPSGGVGSTPDNPVLPTAITSDGTFIISLAPCLNGLACHGGDFFYFDPPSNVAGYTYAVDPTSSPFDGVILPVGLGMGRNQNQYVLTLNTNVPTKIVLTGGVAFHFAAGSNVHNFGILGISVGINPSNVRGFPTGLTFVPGPIVGTLQMTPVKGS